MQPGNSVSWRSLKSNAEKAMQPLAEGTRVPVAVEKAEYKQASTGSHMVVATLKVFEGDYAPRKILNNFVLSPDSAFAMTMFFRNMAAFGLDDNFFAQLETMTGGPEEHLGYIADALIDRKAWLTMGKPNVYQGVARDNPGNFEPYAGQAAAMVSPGLPGGGLGSASGPPVPQVSTPSVSATPTPETSTASSAASAPPPVPSF